MSRQTKTTPSKRWLMIGGIICAFLILLVLFLPVLLNPDRYRPRMIAYLEEKTGKKVEIGHISVRFFPGVSMEIDNFGVKSPPIFPPSYIVQAARIDAQLDVSALLRGQLVLNSMVLDHPIINLVSDPDGPWNFENPGVQESNGKVPFGYILRVKMNRGTITASNLLPSDKPGPIFFQAEDVSSDLDNLNVDGIIDPNSTTNDGQGTLSANEVKFGSLSATNMKCKIRLQARQVFFSEATAETYGGNANGELSIKLSGKNPSFKTDAHMKNVDVAHLLKSFPNAGGKMTGRLEGALKIEGDITHSLRPMEDWHGTGHLEVRNGQVPSLKLNANLMKLAHYNDLGPAKNDPSSFNFVSTDLELNQDQLSSHLIDIDGYGVDVDGAGTVSLSGSDQLNYHGIAAITSKQGFITNLFARMAGGTLKDGKLSFPFHIGGTIDNPIFDKSYKPPKTE
jgi:uncharacterized protein involved in outer membrane biogenesis